MKIKKKASIGKFLILASVILISQSVFSQKSSLENIINVRMQNSGEIVRNDQVTGYYNFYLLEEKDRKNNHYLLNILDENLNEVKSIKMIKPKHYFLLDAAYNNEAFGFLFFEPKEKKVHLIAYNNDLKLSGNTSLNVTGKLPLAMLQYMAQSEEPTQKIFEAVPGKGFIYYGYENEPKLSYSIMFFNNKMHKIWVSNSDRNDDYDFETGAMGFLSGDFVVSAIAKKESLLSTDIEMFLLAQNIQDGSVQFNIPSATDKYKIMFAEMQFIKAKNQWVVIGEYFDKDDNMMKNESLGIVSLTLDQKGKIIDENYNGWDKITSTVSASDRQLFDKTSIFFQKFVTTSEGNVFAIGEQYRKEFSPLTKKIAVYNMIIFEFDNNFNIKQTKIFEKPKDVINLPKNMLVSNAKMLSFIAKAFGGFGYIHTTSSADKSTFSVQYITNNDEKGKSHRVQVGSIIYTPEKTFAQDKIDFDNDSDRYFVYPAKQGYVMISEYYEKEKRMDRKIVKLNY